MAERTITIFGSQLSYTSWQKDAEKSCTYYNIKAENIDTIPENLSAAFNLSDSFKAAVSNFQHVKNLKLEYITWTEKENTPTTEERPLDSPETTVNEDVSEDNSNTDESNDNNPNPNSNTNDTTQNTDTSNNNATNNTNTSTDTTDTTDTTPNDGTTTPTAPKVVKTKALIITYETQTLSTNQDKPISISSQKVELQVIRSSEYTIVVFKPNINLSLHRLPAVNIGFNNPLSFILEGIKIVKEKNTQSEQGQQQEEQTQQPPNGGTTDTTNNTNSQTAPKGFFFTPVREDGQITKLAKEEYPLAFPVLFRFNLGANEEEMTSPEDMEDTASSSPPALDDGIQWIDINQKIALINIGRIGVSYKEETLYAHLDASFESSALGLYFLGIKAGIQPNNLSELPELGLEGIAVGHKSGAMEIFGFLINIPKEGDDEEYVGQIIIQTAAFQLIGTAMYGITNGQTSLFLYAFLNRPLGGPAFFFVEGLALGFGYNRVVDVPIDQVANFPLVSQAVNPPTMPIEIEDIRQTAISLSTFIQPKIGMMVIMLGVKFSSFQLIKSFALIILTLGERFRLDILGISRLELGLPDNPNIVLEVVIKASFIPDEGTIQVDGLISPNTFIFSPDIRITGGFAFYLWFAGDNAGDFVITMGGYHPRYKKPTHYPTVPRVALNWVVNPKLVFKGNLYFAMTPREVMAGAKMYAKFQGKVSKFFVTADFYCSMDLFMQWAPFRYTIDFGVRIRVRFRVETFIAKATVDLDVSAQVYIWGPKFGGRARVEVSIEVIGIEIGFGFTLRFGKQKRSVTYLSWNKFNTKFLPEPAKAINLSANKGVLSREQKENDKENWVLNAKEIELEVQLSVPFTSFGNGLSKSFQEDEPYTNIFIPSMANAPQFNSSLSIQLDKGQDKFEIKRIVTKNFPTSVWKDNPESKKRLAPLYSGVVIGYKKSTDRPDSSKLPSDQLEYSIEENDTSNEITENAYDEFAWLGDLLQQGENAANFKALDKNCNSYKTFLAKPFEHALLS